MLDRGCHTEFESLAIGRMRQELQQLVCAAAHRSQSQDKTLPKELANGHRFGRRATAPILRIHAATGLSRVEPTRCRSATCRIDSRRRPNQPYPSWLGLEVDDANVMRWTEVLGKITSAPSPAPLTSRYQVTNRPAAVQLAPKPLRPPAKLGSLDPTSARASMQFQATRGFPSMGLYVQYDAG